MEETNDGNKIANRFKGEHIRCTRQVEVDGSFGKEFKTEVKFLSAKVVQSEFLLERTGFKPDDPNLEAKLGLEEKEKLTSDYTIADEKPKEEISQTPAAQEEKKDEIIPQPKIPEHSSLIERFDIIDDGKPKKKRKRISKIKIHHAD